MKTIALYLHLLLKVFNSFISFYDLFILGLPVVPKDAYGNFVIPQDRDGNPLIHIASDGVTPVSAAEWKQWKKFYRDQARTFYKQQQLHMAVQNVPRSSANHSITNSVCFSH